MERRFGHDFSGVRVHTDTQAAESVAAVNARAYTVGQHVAFGDGRYRPERSDGVRLLAHELTHVVQQSSGRTGGDAESRARLSADRVMGGEAIDTGAAGAAPLSLQKAGDGDTKSASANAPAGGPTTQANEPPIDQFEFDKADVPPQHQGHLAELSARLMKAASATVTLSGHTDTVGSEAYNKDLGARRANAVRDFLIKSGVKPERIKTDTKGELEPAAGQPPPKLDPNKGEKNPKNRRVEVRVEGLPTAPKQPSPYFTFDPIDPRKKPQPDLRLPAGYDPGQPKPKPGEKEPKATPSSPAAEKKEGPKVETAVETSLPGKTIETTVEVSWEAKTGIGKKLGSEISFTIHVGPDGLSQVESDMKVLKKTIAEVTGGGAVRELTFSLSLNPALDFDRSGAQHLADEFSIKAKASLEADLVIPKTSVKIPAEISGSVGPDGKTEWELKFKLLTW